MGGDSGRRDRGRCGSEARLEQGRQSVHAGIELVVAGPGRRAEVGVHDIPTAADLGIWDHQLAGAAQGTGSEDDTDA